MRTREKNIIVEITENGKTKRCSYPIVDRKGNLMINRLTRLVNGKLSHSCSSDGRDVRFVGVIWNKPYTIFQELVAERLGLQRTLLLMGDQSDLALASPLPMPTNAPNEIITGMVLKELQLRDKIKARISQLKTSTSK